jgi:hypothetical protein
MLSEYAEEQRMLARLQGLDKLPKSEYQFAKAVSEEQSRTKAAICTYEGSPCKKCGGTIRYLKSHGCRACNTAKGKSAAHRIAQIKRNEKRAKLRAKLKEQKLEAIRVEHLSIKTGELR